MGLARLPRPRSLPRSGNQLTQMWSTPEVLEQPAGERVVFRQCYSSGFFGKSWNLLGK